MNQGYLPVFVGTCELVEENMVRGVVVLDAVQRWRSENAVWGTALHGEGCHQPADGAVEKKLTPKLVWPRQRLHTSPFFPNVGFPGFPFEHGDKLRFLVFTRKPKQDSEGLSSPEFTIN